MMKKTASTNTTNNASSTTDTEASFLGRGWGFPPTWEFVDRQLSVSSGVDNINQSIDLILKTPRGSRPLTPDFGSNLNSFLFRAQDTGLKEELSLSIKSTLLHNEPRIRVLHVTVDYPAEQPGLVSVSIHYQIKNTNTRHNHVFPFSLIEATNLQVKHDGNSRG